MGGKRKNEPTNPKAESVVNQLREEILTESDVDSSETEGDDSLLSLFAALPDEERAELIHPDADELLTNGEGLEANVRKRMLDGALRGLAHRRRLTQRLQVYLEQLRADRELTAAEVASQLGLDEEEIVAVERGERSLVSLETKLLADWIRHLEGDVTNAMISLKNSLGLGQPAFSYSQRERRLSPEDELKAEDFVRKVESELAKS